MFIMFPLGCFNLAEGVSSSASAQHQLTAVAALGQHLVDTTGAASRLLFVGSVQRVYFVADIFSRLKKTRTAVCSCTEQLRSPNENPALRHNRYFNIATAHRPHEAMHVPIRINEICSSDTGLCSRRISVEY